MADTAQIQFLNISARNGQILNGKEWEEERDEKSENNGACCLCRMSRWESWVISIVYVKLAPPT